LCKNATALRSRRITQFPYCWLRLLSRANWQPADGAALSSIEPDRRDLARVSPRQYFGKVAAIFLIVGPPTFGLLFCLAISIANPNADTLFTKINEALGIAFSLYGLTSYAIGFVPSLIAAFAYSKSYDHKRPIGPRLLVAALIGAAVYFLVCSLVLFFLYSGRIGTGAWLFTVYAAGAGAVSAFLCALIVENYTKPMQAAQHLRIRGKCRLLARNGPDGPV
jgi:hypothetical protein